MMSSKESVLKHFCGDILDLQYITNLHHIFSLLCRMIFITFLDV
jgi:hypothetical protein